MVTSSIEIDIGFSVPIALTCYFSWYFYQQGKVRWALVCILLLGALFRIYAGMDGYLHVWDERYHALVAKNMIQTPFKPMLYNNPVLPYDFRAWCCNHIWLNKPPLPFWLMSGSMSLFGINLWALRLPSFLLSLTGIIITFHIGSILFSKKAGLIAAFLYAVNGKLIELAAGCDSSDHIETCHIVIFEIAILWILRYWKRQTVWLAALIGLSTGLTFLSKWTPAVFIPAIWLIGSVWQKMSFKRLVIDGLILSAAAFVIAAPWVWHIFYKFPKESKEIYTIMATANTHVIEEHSGAWYYYLNKVRIIFGETIYLPMLAGVWLVFRKKSYSKLSLLFIWIGLPLLLFSMAATKRDTYLMILAPAFFLLIAYWVRVLQVRVRKPWGIIGVTLLLLLPLRYGIERSKLFTGRQRVPEWMMDIKNIEQHLTTAKGKTIVLGFEHNLELMFHTGVIAYPIEVDKQTIQTLKDEHYTVMRYHEGKLSAY